VFRIHSEATGELVARARQRVVFVGVGMDRPHRLPDDECRRFDGVLVPDEDA
jgi:acyl-CoA thioesterase FadM